MKKNGVFLLVMLIFFACQKDDQQSQNQDMFQSSEKESVTQDDQTPVEATIYAPDTTSVSEQDSAEPQQEVKQLTRLDQVEITDNSSVNDLWAAYNQVKNNINIYKDSWQYENLVQALDQAAQIAIKLNRPDIASWQYNNIGYYSILEFKNRTDYTNRMKDLEVMPAGDEKYQYIQETRDLMRQEFYLLESAKEHLYDAMEMNSQSPEKDREKIINSNVDFINSITEYINS